MMFTMIVCNDVLDIFIQCIDNDPRADIGTPVFMTDLSTDWYMGIEYRGRSKASQVSHLTLPSAS